MDSQTQDGNFSRVWDLWAIDFGAQNEPKIVIVEACESKLIPQWFWDCFAARFSLIWTPLWKSFWAYFGMQNLGKANQAHPRKSLKKPSVFAWFCKGGGSLWKSDDMNERYFLSSENGFMLTSFIRSIFHFIWEAFGASFGSIWTSKTSPNHDPNKRSKNDQS